MQGLNRKSEGFVIPEFILLFAVTIFSASAQTNSEYPLADIVARARAAAAANTLPATDLTRDDYLKTTAGIVAFFEHFQTPAGRIIDPYLHREVQYSTPCYAWAAAALVQSGRQTNLLPSAARALTAALDEVSSGHAANNHGDFFTFPCVFAYEALRDRVSPGQRQHWEDDLRAITPERSYHDRPASGKEVHNWNVVALCGDFLRRQDGFCGMEYVEKCLGLQMKNFTDDGLYRDPNVPMAYDHFPRSFLAAVVERGYHGAYYDQLTNDLERAAWTSLLIQSPLGELPTGGRSAQHQWNEAIQCLTYEIWATRKERAGDDAGARLFKRAAHLSLQSIRRWLRPSGELWIVKNYFDPGLRHGFQGYSTHSQYNLLAASMMSAAWLFANDDIGESASFAETGGFAFQLPEFHKVIANSGGLYVEIETDADHHYNSTGLLRVQKLGVNSLIGPSDNSPAEVEPAATGISWRTNGRWQSLSALTNGLIASTQFSLQPAPPGDVAFKIQYTPAVSETYQVSPNGIQVAAEAAGSSEIRVGFPAVTFDGRDASDILVSGPEADVTLSGSRERFTVTTPDGAQLSRSGHPVSYRNGFLEMITADIPGSRVIYTLSPTADNMSPGTPQQ